MSSPEPTSEVSEDYSAKTFYEDYAVGANYEELRFGGRLGKYRRRAELRGVRQALEGVERGSEWLDCPCGIGRWWPELAPTASKIVALDISPGMRQHAAERAERMSGLDISIREGDAEALPLEDDSVDWTFSFALTKHLPLPVQYRVLSEFARVSRRGVVSTFGVFDHLSYEVWHRRKLHGSFPVLSEQLDQMAAEAGLRVEAAHRCTTPIGTEHVVRMRSL